MSELRGIFCLLLDRGVFRLGGGAELTNFLALGCSFNLRDNGAVAWAAREDPGQRSIRWLAEDSHVPGGFNEDAWTVGDVVVEVKGTRTIMSQEGLW